LAFREGPAAIRALEKIKEADLLLFDGHGIAHPRRMGIATHLGICFDKPSIGCAKSILTGRPYPGGKKNEKILPVYDGKEKVGFALKIKEKGRPLFVSPGHLIDFETTLNIIPALLRGHKIPEPLRIAHIYANRYKKEGKNGENKKNCSCLFRRT
ncbi:endonuclease V, partial [Candidatus Aerophobetes bacterium]|nr:endonuclease V [Candidatus Aerophobetes bacterium]